MQQIGSATRSQPLWFSSAKPVSRLLNRGFARRLLQRDSVYLAKLKWRASAAVGAYNDDTEGRTALSRRGAYEKLARPDNAIFCAVIQFRRRNPAKCTPPIMTVRLRAKRVEEQARDWRVVVHDVQETPSSFIAFGTRDHRPVVLKVVRQPGDEWRCGEVLAAFDGSGVVRVYEYVEGAVLLERLNPGTALASLSLDGHDEEATEILAEVIHRMSRPQTSLETFITVADWGKGFERYLASGDGQIPIELVERGQHIYLQLCASQQNVRLLHGDLQHYNVLFDTERGWVAIDPKGVVGELEYELGASLRNPYERPDLFAAPSMIERRLKQVAARLPLDPERALRWSFAQAVLSAIWSVEDGFAVDARNPALILAQAIWPMLS